MNEQLYQIQTWTRETFGTPTKEGGFLKLAEEFGELAEALRGKSDKDTLIELADIVIVACHLANALGGSIYHAVDRKMQLNVARKWNVSLDRTGDHRR